MWCFKLELQIESKQSTAEKSRQGAQLIQKAVNGLQMANST